MKLDHPSFPSFIKEGIKGVVKVKAPV